MQSTLQRSGNLCIGDRKIKIYSYPRLLHLPLQPIFYQGIAGRYISHKWQAIHPKKRSKTTADFASWALLSRLGGRKIFFKTPSPYGQVSQHLGNQLLPRRID
jgi:hypothetical protein